jgi:B9 domain-containing protein 1
LFLPKPISLITGFFGYLNGCIAEFKEAEKVLATGDGREVTRVKTVGFAKIKV